MHPFSVASLSPWALSSLLSSSKSGKAPFLGHAYLPSAFCQPATAQLSTVSQVPMNSSSLTAGGALPLLLVATWNLGIMSGAPAAILGHLATEKLRPYAKESAAER